MRVIIACLAYLSFSTGFCGRGGGSESYNVEFYIGGVAPVASLTYHVASFHPVQDRNLELAGRFRGMRARDLPFGNYEYRLEPDDARLPPGICTIEGSVQLHSGDNLVTREFGNCSMADDAPMHIVGRVTPMPRTKGIPWIRVQSALESSHFTQGPLARDGGFRLPWGRTAGDYIITVCDGSQVLHVSVYHFNGLPPANLEVHLHQ